MQQCPEFFSPLNNGCVYDCSQHTLFHLTTEGGQPKCKYEFGDEHVELVPQNPVPILLSEVGSGVTPPIPALAVLQTSDPSRYTRYKAELDRVNSGIEAILSTVEKDRLADDAFEALQRAELTRASDPVGYQKARNYFYTLKKGGEWMDEEKTRIASAEVDPEIQRYRDAYTTAMQQKVGQQKTLDIVEAVKDRVLSLKDDFQYSTSMFKQQLDNVKSQLNVERRGRQTTPLNEATSTFYGWLNIVVNLVLIVLAVYLAMTAWRAIRKRLALTQGAYTVQVATR